MPNIFVNVKSVGKRKPALNAVSYTLPDGIATLRDLITAVVRIETERYNARETEKMLLPFLTEAQIEDQSVAGKVGFGRIYAERKADPKAAVETALQGFEDGLFRVIVNDSEVKESDASIRLNEGDTLTFVRLSFLAGRLW